jgi:hypothetical protein
MIPISIDLGRVGLAQHQLRIRYWDRCVAEVYSSAGILPTKSSYLKRSDLSCVKK